MSISRGFSPEELEALAVWRLPDVHKSAAGRAEARVEELQVAPPAITAEEIEAIQKQAYEEAAELGRQEGYREGQQRGFEEGQQQGYAAGYQAGEQAMADARRSYGEQMQQVLSALASPLAKLDEQVEHELVLLAVAIAKQVVRRELKTDPGQIVATVRSAAGSLPSVSREIALYLHPDDAELVRTALSLVEGGPPWTVVEDPLITRGGCRVSSELSMVDATVEKRLAQAVAQVLGDDREASGER